MQREEFLRVAEYATLEEHGNLVEVALKEIIPDNRLSLRGRIYGVKVEPDIDWYKQRGINPEEEFWVVVIERLVGPSSGTTLPINLYSKREFPSALDAYNKHKEVIKSMSGE
ncbi:MAG: hypothetical protein ACE5J3_02275 [Methanosarcinales archaeon]